MKFLVTGAAGFIGSGVCKALCTAGHEVVGLDNLNEYYDVGLKHARLASIGHDVNFTFVSFDLSESEKLNRLFSAQQFNRVIHLAAQAGVRYSHDKPMVFAESNLVGHLAILEACRHHKIEHLVYASSSSVYGLNDNIPFSTSQSVDHPISLYAATKKANELMSHSYSHLYDLPTTGLRVFTVYGPWGRPDMALFKFTKAIYNGDPIDVYNYGNLSRDFTFIDDIIEGVVRVQDKIPQRNDNWRMSENALSESSAPYRIYNLGNGKPVKLMDFIRALEDAIGIKAFMNLLPLQSGDVHDTWADSSDLFELIDYQPTTDIRDGISHFVSWYKEYYNV
jgi:UDP-glucuronate 4-epimerase